MPATQILKKKLKGIRSTQKISKAMKTASTARLSQLNGMYSAYSPYGNRCKTFYEDYKGELESVLPAVDENVPECIIVMASNKGMCGSFNSELFLFAEQFIFENPKNKIIICGKQAIAHFTDKKIPFDKSYVFDDVPAYSDCYAFLHYIYSLRVRGTVRTVKVVYQKYVNVMKQIPSVQKLFSGDNREDMETNVMFIPDRNTVVANMAEKIFMAVAYELILETALGAQAATLMTMRSAYDTATEYCEVLESEINRKRQSAVTEDVIETSSEPME